MGEPALKDPFDISEDPEEILDDDEQGEFPEGHGKAEDRPEEEDKGKGKDEAAALRGEIEALKRQQRESEERYRSEEEKKKARLEFGETKAKELQDLEATISDLRTKRRAAINDADDDLADNLEEQIAEARFKRAALRQIEYQESKPERRHPEDEIAPAARAWLTLNPHFHSDPEFNAKVLDINSKLKAEGLAVDDPKFYRELDRRLSQRQVKPASVAGVNRGNPSAPSPTGRRQFTQADKEKMIKYGFGDPNNPEDRKSWLRYSGGKGV